MQMKKLLVICKVNEELDIDSDNELDFETEGETVNEESSNEERGKRERESLLHAYVCVCVGRGYNAHFQAPENVFSSTS
jgi:hypothetical protein